MHPLHAYFRISVPSWTRPVMSYCLSVTVDRWRRSRVCLTPVKKSMTPSSHDLPKSSLQDGPFSFNRRYDRAAWLSIMLSLTYQMVTYIWCPVLFFYWMITSVHVLLYNLIILSCIFSIAVLFIEFVCWVMQPEE